MWYSKHNLSWIIFNTWIINVIIILTCVIFLCPSVYWNQVYNCSASNFFNKLSNWLESYSYFKYFPLSYYFIIVNIVASTVLSYKAKWKFEIGWFFYHFNLMILDVCPSPWSFHAPAISNFQSLFQWTNIDLLDRLLTASDRKSTVKNTYFCLWGNITHDWMFPVDIKGEKWSRKFDAKEI